ncbi:complement component C9-like [Pantherophis guttatus]|uniref:Complement component C9 n=1 Tax=Pantherophis guttatus TaxID=94885 RepID=A0A6P9DLJ2_PANGU|nr:complement component C9-like [Pantherophis guttatus]
MSSSLLLIGVLCILGANGFASAGKARLKREPNAPEPIDCLLTTWDDWGPCSPCSSHRYRSRSILKFGQFGGKPCIEALSDRESCETRTPCPDGRGHCGKQEFECENGYCLKGRLVCNTEDDCGDFSDEDNCDETKRPPCGDRVIDVSELGRTAGQGINVLGMKPAQKPFYNEFYNGICDRVRDGNTATYYRKPWNTAFLSYETRGDKKITSEFYSDQASTMKQIFKTKSHSLDASFSLQLQSTSFPLSGGFETSVNFSKSSNLSDFLEKTKGKNYEYLHVKSNIQLGTFQLRKRNLRLSETFLEDLKMLPSTYEKGEYFIFLETYGTHYSQRGTIGGKYELIYVLDNRTMTSQRITRKDVNECLGFNLDLGANIFSAEVKAKIKNEKCKDEKLEKNSTNEKSRIIQDVVSLIQGGTTATLTKLNEMLSSNVNSVDVEQYVEWAATLPQAPAVIKQQMAPISELIPLNIPDSRMKKVNLDRAVEDYVAEYNVCKCKPCLHGGTVMLLDGKCECACTPFYKGDGCEIPASDLIPADPAVHGSWSCWSNWSTCQQGQRRRTRKCDNPAPGYRGKSCPGANSEPGYC